MDEKQKMQGGTRDENNKQGSRWVEILAGVAGLFITIVLIGIGPANIPIFIDVPSLAIIFGIVFCGMMISHGNDCVEYAIKASCRGIVESEDGAVIAEDVLSLAQRLCLYAGALGTMTGYILLLKEGMSDPAKLTQGCAVANITLLYGIAGAVLFELLRSRIVCALMQLRGCQKWEALEVLRPKKTSSWVLPLVLVLVMLEGVAFLFLHSTRSDGYQLSIANDTQISWNISGHVICSPGEIRTTEPQSEYVWPHYLVPSDSAKLDFVFGMEREGERARLVLFVVDKKMSYKTMIECEWPEGSRSLHIRLSDHIPAEEIRTLSNRYLGRPPEELPGAPTGTPGATATTGE